MACCAPDGFLKLNRAVISSREGRALPLLKETTPQFCFKRAADFGRRKSTCSVHGFEVTHSSSRYSYIAKGETRPGEGRE